jgi:nucleoside-diphosphate-sugar epimerase
MVFDKTVMSNYNHQIVQEDLASLINTDVPWERLRNRCLLVTGATSMLGAYFAYVLLYLNRHRDFGINLVLLARSRDKLEKTYGAELDNVDVLAQDVREPIHYAKNIDYVLHAASLASARAMVTEPINIIEANTVGTRQVLELAKAKGIKNLVFTSTREVYGKVEGCTTIDESTMGVLDPLDPRSCYPESKRAAEALIVAYAVQHEISFNVLRIAHCYGPGMKIDNDGRVLSDFLSDALGGGNIKLKGSGEAERAFCYITDAVEAMYRVLLGGERNAAYNIANESEPVQIVELANRVQRLAGNGREVETAKETSLQGGYTNYTRVPLDTAKVRALGWAPIVALTEGLTRTLSFFTHGR